MDIALSARYVAESDIVVINVSINSGAIPAGTSLDLALQDGSVVLKQVHIPFQVLSSSADGVHQALFAHIHWVDGDLNVLGRVSNTISSAEKQVKVLDLPDRRASTLALVNKPDLLTTQPHNIFPYLPTPMPNGGLPHEFPSVCSTMSAVLDPRVLVFGDKDIWPETFTIPHRSSPMMRGGVNLYMNPPTLSVSSAISDIKIQTLSSTSWRTVPIGTFVLDSTPIWLTATPMLVGVQDLSITIPFSVTPYAGTSNIPSSTHFVFNFLNASNQLVTRVLKPALHCEGGIFAAVEASEVPATTHSLVVQVEMRSCDADDYWHIESNPAEWKLVSGREGYWPELLLQSNHGEVTITVPRSGKATVHLELLPWVGVTEREVFDFGADNRLTISAGVVNWCGLSLPLGNTSSKVKIKCEWTVTGSRLSVNGVSVNGGMIPSTGVKHGFLGRGLWGHLQVEMLHMSN